MSNIETGHIIKIKPFLRWAGGKKWLTKQIEDFLPQQFNNYYEPFLGGGAIFLHLKSHNLIKQNAYLSDFNEELINAYEHIQIYPEEVITRLSSLINTKEEYYHIRSLTPTSEIDQAVRFIYLNKTSFNGIYRVNLKGEYNVPYGFKKTKNLFEFDNIRHISDLLNNSVTFNHLDFFDISTKVKKGDLVFLDPPYTVAHENNGFVKYNQKIFQWSDQERLKDLLDIINQKEAFFILTNAAHISVEELFSSTGKMIKVNRASNIGGKGATRSQVNEFLFTNI